MIWICPPAVPVMPSGGGGDPENAADQRDGVLQPGRVAMDSVRDDACSG